MKNRSEHAQREGSRSVDATTAPPHPGLPASEEQHGTRGRVARSILDHGPSSAAELAERLGLTQAAVRRHLDALTADRIVEARERRVHGARGRGRPAKVFALTDEGRESFEQAYDQLAVDALRWIARGAGGGELGEAAVLAFARARADALAERYRAEVERAEPHRRTAALAAALSRDGFAAAARSAPAPGGEQLCQHHCPVAHAAERFPQLCEAETEVFSRLLGTHVQRLATIAHGDGVCTTFVPSTTPGDRTRAHHRHASRPPSRGGRPTGAAPGAPGAASNTTAKTASPRTAGRNPA
ncbi:winged helix-turn-helix transcriptional regulator [Streptomyces alkaliphilus]|uniref:Winged helix-turn-helix transcriptional regulator n=1 Tax=Streptomyces alkaliphilus TaxID=1472722 RepID=A0A7W3TDH6_9ACTN|nr:winged helix-turn-helix transcriptional regulator [Streptomyces alkaliphilus]